MVLQGLLKGSVCNWLSAPLCKLYGTEYVDGTGQFRFKYIHMITMPEEIAMFFFDKLGSAV